MKHSWFATKALRFVLLIGTYIGAWVFPFCFCVAIGMVGDPQFGWKPNVPLILLFATGSAGCWVSMHRARELWHKAFEKPTCLNGGRR